MVDSEDLWGDFEIFEAKRVCELKFKEYLKEEINRYQSIIEDIGARRGENSYVF